jgi:hypothetical protein
MRRQSAACPPAVCSGSASVTSCRDDPTVAPRPPAGRRPFSEKPLQSRAGLYAPRISPGYRWVYIVHRITKER